MEESIRKSVYLAIDSQVFPGSVVGIVNRAGQRWVMPFGRYTYEGKSPVVKEDSLYDVASITKSIPTASVALKLIDEGRLHLDDKVLRFIPELANSHRDSVKVWHLLTHTLCFSYQLSAYRDLSAETILNELFSKEFGKPPGSSFSYSNGASILLGILIERICGTRLDLLADEWFFKPLKMEKTGFFPLLICEKEQIVPTEIDLWRNRVIQGEVHDESTYALRSAIIPGSAGLFSTVPDLLNFLQMLLMGGVLEGRRFFSPRAIEQMRTNQIGPIGGCTGLGWELMQHSFMGLRCSDQTIGKTGFTGCSCVCDMEQGVGIVLLSNYTFPRRKQTREPIDLMRRVLADIVFEYHTKS
jgi:CubicO group peptidase (beta-lactamase class C family)